MNIASMLVRLQTMLDQPDLLERIVLLRQQPWHMIDDASEINLVVGYSNSSCSQAALDLTLLMAHQSRLAGSKPVTVQVAYVMEDKPGQMGQAVPLGSSTPATPKSAGKPAAKSSAGQVTVAEPAGSLSLTSTMVSRTEQFEYADRVLWQARCLAEQWRGALKTHLRFGDLAGELRHVVQSENASLLILGCESAQHPLVRRLGLRFPCPILGIPKALHEP